MCKESQRCSCNLNINFFQQQKSVFVVPASTFAAIQALNTFSVQLGHSKKDIKQKDAFQQSTKRDILSYGKLTIF